MNNMKTRYRIMCRGSRGGSYYCVDALTGKRTSLQTQDEDKARQIVEAKNLAERQPEINPTSATGCCFDFFLGVSV